jgi:HEAT repeat protein
MNMQITRKVQIMIIIMALGLCYLGRIGYYKIFPRYSSFQNNDLITLMGNDDIIIRQRAANELLNRGDKQIFIRALNNSNDTIRETATHWLSSFNDPTLQPYLLKMLNDNDLWVRKWACYSLGKIGNKESIIYLNKMSSDSSENVRNEAREAVEKIHKRDH